MANFGPFPAISGHVHGPRWSKMSFKHLYFSGKQCCFNNICPKIDIWGCRCSRWPSFGHFRPPRGLRWSSPKCQMLKMEFQSHLYKINFALKCIPEAVLNGLLLLGVALKAPRGFNSNHVFWGPLTTQNTWKKVPSMGEFLWFSATTYGLTVLPSYYILI